MRSVDAAGLECSAASTPCRLSIGTKEGRGASVGAAAAVASPNDAN